MGLKPECRLHSRVMSSQACVSPECRSSKQTDSISWTFWKNCEISDRHISFLIFFTESLHMSNSDLTISSKLPGVEQSIFSIMTALAVKHNAINLAQGFPDFNCPPKLIEYVNKYMLEGKNQYAAMPGIMPLRQKIAAKTEKLYGAKYDPETEITITAGATQAIYLAISAFIKQNDEVIIFEPAY